MNLIHEQDGIGQAGLVILRAAPGITPLLVEGLQPSGVHEEPATVAETCTLHRVRSASTRQYVDDSRR